ncbi:MAG: ATP-binding protein [Candidatus Limnocylindria bacterium]
MGTFFNRQHELDDIKAILAEARCSLTIVYGPRGVGKSRLFEEAIGSGAYYSYTATERVMSQQLDDMRTALVTLKSSRMIAGSFSRFEQLLDTLADVADTTPKEPLPIVIDEFPYLADADPALLTALQKWWQAARKKRTNLKLFLLGSRVSWMEKEALSPDAALKSVRTNNMAIDELNYLHAAQFYPTWSAQDKVRGWAVWGGLPAALEEIQSNKSLWDNIEYSTLQTRAKLYAEPDWMKFTELRSNAIYTSIVRAIADGAGTPANIADAVGKKAANEVTPYLDNLREARVVERRPSMNADGDAPRTALYMVKDPFLAYWYRFVDRHRSALQRRMVLQVLQVLRDPDHGLDKLVSELAFEDISRSFLFEAAASGRLPRDLTFDTVGAWWTGGKTLRSEELDVVAYQNRKLVAVGECKWTNDPVDEGEVHDLDRIVQAASAELKPAPNLYRMLFSRSGFSKAVRDRAADTAQRILLFEPKALYW